MKLTDLFEGESINDLVKQFMQWGNSKEGKDSWGDTLDVLHDEPGTCAMVSEDFLNFLKKKGLTPKMITGTMPTNKEWLKHMSAEDQNSHTAVLVNGKVIDFTAQQFDKSLPYPRIIPLSKFKSEWEKIR